LEVISLARGDQAKNLVSFRLNGTLRTSRIGSLRTICHARFASYPRHDFFRILKIWNHGGSCEVSHFYDRETGLGQSVYHLNLRIGVDPTMETLQAIASRHINDLYRARYM